jgi:hypothetical protein
MSVRVVDVKKGTILYTDAGFTCMPPNARREVHEDEHGLWIACRRGRHYLDGQIDRNLYVGLTLNKGVF